MKIGRLGGAGSDYAAFLQHIGVPAADMHFGAGNKHIVFCKLHFYLTMVPKRERITYMPGYSNGQLDTNRIV